MKTELVPSLPKSSLSFHALEDRVVGIDLFHRVPAQKGKARNETLLKPVSIDVVLPAADASQEAYQRFHETSESELNEHLRVHYSFSGATRITVHKLANFLASYVCRFGKSKPLWEVLTHGNLSKQVALYCLNIDIDELRRFQQSYIDWLNEHTTSSLRQLKPFLSVLETLDIGDLLFVDAVNHTTKRKAKRWKQTLGRIKVRKDSTNPRQKRSSVMLYVDAGEGKGTRVLWLSLLALCVFFDVEQEVASL